MDAQLQQIGEVKVDWRVANEVNITNYTLQHSANGNQFTDIGTINATNSSLYTKNDPQPFVGNNYYRIKATGIGGEILYSPMAKIIITPSAEMISVFPNPVKQKLLQVKFAGMQAGNYQLSMYNAK